MHDTKEIIKCPACNTEMKKVFIESKGFNLDICENCGGILFDNLEFKHFDEQHESINEITDTLQGKTFEKQNESKTRICPVCLAPMVKNYASSLKEVEIDECYSCGAKFLDGGELERIRAQFKTEEDRRDKFTEDLYKELDEAISKAPYKFEENYVQKNSFIVDFIKKFTK